MTKLVQIDGRWKLVTINARRHLCDVCNEMSYTWKDYDKHIKTHTFAEHDRALWQGVDAKIQWHMDRNCPT